MKKGIIPVTVKCSIDEIDNITPIPTEDNWNDIVVDVFKNYDKDKLRRVFNDFKWDNIDEPLKSRLKEIEKYLLS